MAKKLTKGAVQIGERVEGGRPYTEDFDQGEIIGYDADQDSVQVAWAGSLVQTWQDRTGLRLGWSERWPDDDE